MSILNRRHLLKSFGVGMGLAGLATVFAQAGLAGPLAPCKPCFAGKAKRVIHIFANGGPRRTWIRST